MDAVSTIVPPESEPVSRFTGTSGFVPLTAPDLRRPITHALRNAAAIVVALLAITALLAFATHASADALCVSAAKDLRAAEADYLRQTGAYTDVAGLKYAGLIPNRYSAVKVTLDGTPGRATAFHVVSDGIC